MCTLCLSDMEGLRDDWLREPVKKPVAPVEAARTDETGDAAIAPPAFLLHQGQRRAKESASGVTA